MARMIPLLALLWIAIPSAHADKAPSPLHAGPGLTSSEKVAEHVQMQAEEVDLELSLTDLHVKVTFHMKNTGPETRIREGFPIGAYQDALKDFVYDRDGKTVDMEIVDLNSGKPDSDFPRGHRVSDYWYVWETVYPAHTEIVDTVTYTMPLTLAGSRGNYESFRGGYILHTGAAWKGVIERVVVTMTFKNGMTKGHLRELGPAGFIVTETGAQWTLSNIEPTKNDDIKVEINPQSTIDEVIVQTLSQHRTLEQDTIGLYLYMLRDIRRAGAIPWTPANVDRKKYWDFVQQLVDFYAPYLPAGEQTTVPRKLGTDPLFADLLAEAVASWKEEEGARRVLPRLRDLVIALAEKRLRVDGPNARVLELYAYLGKNERSKLEADLKAADTLLRTNKDPVIWAGDDEAKDPLCAACKKKYEAEVKAAKGFTSGIEYVEMCKTCGKDASNSVKPGSQILVTTQSCRRCAEAAKICFTCGASTEDAAAREKRIEKLMGDLASSDEKTHATAAEELKKLGEPARKALQDNLDLPRGFVKDKEDEKRFERFKQRAEAVIKAIKTETDKQWIWEGTHDGKDCHGDQCPPSGPSTGECARCKQKRCASNHTVCGICAGELGICMHCQRLFKNDDKAKQ